MPAPLAPIRGPELWPDRLARAGAGPAALQQPRSGTPAAARPPLVSQPALSRPARRRPSPPARGPLVNPCPTACPLIGGGGAPGHGDPPPTVLVSSPTVGSSPYPPPQDPPLLPRRANLARKHAVSLVCLHRSLLIRTEPIRIKGPEAGLGYQRFRHPPALRAAPEWPPAERVPTSRPGLGPPAPSLAFVRRREAGPATPAAARARARVGRLALYASPGICGLRGPPPPPALSWSPAPAAAARAGVAALRRGPGSAPGLPRGRAERSAAGSGRGPSLEERGAAAAAAGERLSPRQGRAPGPGH